jgi:hypothetical protein
MSSPSDYSSDYSDDERRSASTHTHATSPSPQDAQHQHRRRPSSPSRGASDKRRMAIVEMDVNAPHVRHPSLRRRPSRHDSEEPPPGSPKLAARRGQALAGLALVAPPDFSPTKYLDMEPPMSAPVPVHHERAPSEIEPSISGSSASAHGHSHHHRTQSEAVAAERKRSIRRKRSRDVGIVGVSPEKAVAHLSSHPHARPGTDVLGPGTQPTMPLGLAPPVFQTPHSRSPSPGVMLHSDASSTSMSSFGAPCPPSLGTATGLAAADADATPTKRRAAAGPLTPDIGEGKAVGAPVAGPVVVGLGIQEPWLAPGLSRGSSQHPYQNAAASAPGASSSHTSVSHYTSSSSSYYASPLPSPPAMAAVSSPYLNYQPGVHATAGPLPPPPRAIFEIAAGTPPPPRPPRLHSPPPTRSPAGIAQELEKAQPSSLLPVQATAPPLQRGFSDFSIVAMSDSSDGESALAR